MKSLMFSEFYKGEFEDIGYELSFDLLNVADFGIPQDRKRVFFVGYRKDLKLKFSFPKSTTPDKKITLQRAIGDLKENAVPALEGNYTNGSNCLVPNHEFMIGGFSSIYMSRNRVRGWHEASFTIQAGGRHAPIHPQAPPMTFISQNLRTFATGQEHLYRRLSIRECARIQTFPDRFVFSYNNLVAGYKMIGNAVPVRMGKILATKILADLTNIDVANHKVLSGQLNGELVKEKMYEIVNN